MKQVTRVRMNGFRKEGFQSDRSEVCGSKLPATNLPYGICETNNGATANQPVNTTKLASNLRFSG